MDVYSSKSISLCKVKCKMETYFISHKNTHMYVDTWEAIKHQKGYTTYAISYHWLLASPVAPFTNMD